MKNIVSYSGGLGSFMTAELCRREGLDFELVFCNTNSEDDDLYRFLNETEKYFGKKIIQINDGSDIWQVQIDVKFQANSRIDPCSRVLKREPFKKWMRETYAPDQARLLIGIGKGESHRTKDFARNHAPFEVDAPLTRHDISHDDIVEILHGAGIEPPRLYEWGFQHNNCGGFCVKAGQKQAALLLKKCRENYLKHEEKQERMFDIMGHKHPTIRRTIDGVMQYMSLREFREFLESGGKPELYEEGACACF